MKILEFMKTILFLRLNKGFLTFLKPHYYFKMSRVNKNYQDIKNFMPSNHLFQKQKHTNAHHFSSNNSRQLNQPINHSSNHKKSHRHQYYLLNELPHQHKAASELKAADKNETNSNNKKRINFDDVSQSRKNHDNQSNFNLTVEVRRHRQVGNSPIEQQGEIMSEQKKTVTPKRRKNVWESVITKSSGKYFDSCRNEALDYLDQMEGVLEKNKNFLSNGMQQIRQEIISIHCNEGQILKEGLYRVVDQVVEIWKQMKIKESQNKEIEYLGQIFQLSTQIQRRMSQLDQFKAQMKEGRKWKDRASYLLTNNHEENILDLSKLCEKSIAQAYENVQSYSLLEQKYNSLNWKSVEITLKKDILLILNQSVDEDGILVDGPQESLENSMNAFKLSLWS